MYSLAWQIGLDIQSRSLRAIALQCGCSRWQLTHCWWHPLPEDTFRDESLHHPEYLIPILQRWRNHLPRRFSLRIALPALHILHQLFPAPLHLQHKQALQWYATSQLAPLLPSKETQVAMDYRLDILRDTAEPTQLHVTAARQEELNNRLDCLAAVGLQPDVVDITPSILRILASKTNVPADSLLVQCTDSHLLWASPWGAPLQFGTFALNHATLNDPLAQIAAATEAYTELGHSVPASTYFGTHQPNDLADTVTAFSPFGHLNRFKTALPEHPLSYTLAMGLALREKDRL